MKLGSPFINIGINSFFKNGQQRRYFTFYLDCNDCNYWSAVCCMEPVYSPELLSSATALFLLFVLSPSALKLLSAVQSEWPPLEPQPRSEIIHLKAGLPAHADLTVQPYCCRLWNPTADVRHEKENFSTQVARPIWRKSSGEGRW